MSGSLNINHQGNPGLSMTDTRNNNSSAGSIYSSNSTTINDLTLTVTSPNSYIYTSLTMRAKNSGTAQIEVSHPAAWRTALQVPSTADLAAYASTADLAAYASTADLSGKVDKTGDTMTGNLTTSGGFIGLTLTSKLSFNVIGGNVADYTIPGFTVTDLSNYDIANFGAYDGYGEYGASLEGVKGDIKNYLRLGIDSSNNQVVRVSSASAWRSAIGAVNKAGDTMTGLLTIDK